MPPVGARIRGETVRESLRRALREGFATALDLSRSASIPEREVAAHLEHIERSARAVGERLLREGPECLACGFDFPGRRRHTRPGQCPRCRSRRITLPRFRLAG